MIRESESIAPPPFWFRLVVRVNGVAVSTNSPATMRYPGEDRITIQFRQPLESELPEESRNHPQYETPAIFDGVGTARMRHIVPRRVRKALLENEAGWEWVPQIDDHVWSMSKELQASFDPFVASIHAKLIDALLATYRVLRWRHGLDGTVKPFSAVRLEWSRTGRKWSDLPGPVKPIWFDLKIRDLPFDLHEVNETKTFLRKRAEEPVAHELFREAWDQCSESPRAALVIGMAAAEIGVKDFIARRLPKAGWLVKENAMQDWMKLFAEYLPSLLEGAQMRFVHGMDEKRAYKDPVLRRLRNGVTLRNAVVHRSDQKAPPQKDVRYVLLAVRDLLYLLDYHSSQKWAMNWIGKEAKAAWQSGAAMKG